MLVFDGHLDLAWNALQWNRDLTRPVAAIRLAPQSQVQFSPGTPAPARMEATVSLPEMRRGGVRLCFATLLARSTGRPIAHLDWPSPEQAAATAHGQLAYYRSLEATGQAAILTNAAALERHVEATTVSTETIGIAVLMEGADPILSPEALDSWHESGVRAIGLSHYGPGRYAGGTGTVEGLGPSGAALLRGMRRLNMILDVSHLSDLAFTQALEVFDGPVMASHCNCRALVPDQRQLSDEQIRTLISRSGVIGTALDGWMLRPGWERGKTTNGGITLEAVADHIDHVCQIAGNARHAAIGSDLDGGFGRDQSPADVDTISDLQKLHPILTRRGYAQADVTAIQHGNWIALLRRVWGRA